MWIFKLFLRVGVENEINAISAFNYVVVEVEAELGNRLWLSFAKLS